MQLNLQNLKNIKNIKNSYKNYISVIFSLLLNKKKINVKLKNGKVYTWNDLQVRNYIVAYNIKYKTDAKMEFFPELDKIEFNYLSKRLTFFGFLEDGFIYNELVNSEYGNLNFKDRVVLDIGANIGATSVFFALNGAKKVYAIEPMPKTYSILQKNIEINKLTELILPLNYGIGKTSKVNLDESISGLGADINSAIKSSGKTIEIKNLKYIIENYKIGKCVLKMDCEGCEYDALLSLDNDTISNFDEIILEYHYGCTNLKKFLEDNGYKVSCTKPKSSFNNISQTKMINGFLYAYKLKK